MATYNVNFNAETSILTIGFGEAATNDQTDGFTHAYSIKG